MDERYASAYGALARDHWWWQARDAAVLRTFGTLPAPDHAPMRILDVGCGDGRLFGPLSRHGVVEGIEPDGASRGAGSADGTIHAIPFAEPLPWLACFDRILMLDVLEHLDDPAAALDLTRRLLVPGGHLLLTVPAYRVFWTRHDDMNHHRTRFAPRELATLLRAAGLEVVTMRHLFHALMLPKLAVRAIERLGRHSAVEVPTPPPRFLNNVARGWFILESRLPAGLAAALPGTSLLAVARRR